MPDRMRGMLGRVALVSAVVLASMLHGGVAWAGGPTSVLLVSPDSQRATALYTSDPSYHRLMTLLGGEAPTGAAAGDASPGGSRYVTVTWLIHDVTVWRTDRIALDTPDGAWVVTQMTQPGGQDPDAVRHRPTDPDALRSLLSGLGLSGGAVATPSPGGAAAPVAAGTVPAPAGTGVDSAVWWALAGLVVGAGATVVGLRVSPRVRRVLAADSAERSLAVTGR